MVGDVYKAAIGLSGEGQRGWKGGAASCGAVHGAVSAVVWGQWGKSVYSDGGAPATGGQDWADDISPVYAGAGGVWVYPLHAFV